MINKLWNKYMYLKHSFISDTGGLPIALPDKDKVAATTQVCGVSFLDLFKMLDTIIEDIRPMEKKIANVIRFLHILEYEYEDKQILTSTELKDLKTAIKELEEELEEEKSWMTWLL